MANRRSPCGAARQIAPTGLARQQPLVLLVDEASTLASEPFASEFGPSVQTPAPDDTQSSAVVLSSRLVSAVGASMSDGPVRAASTPRDRRREP